MGRLEKTNDVKTVEFLSVNQLRVHSKRTFHTRIHGTRSPPADNCSDRHSMDLTQPDSFGAAFNTYPEMY